MRLSLAAQAYSTIFMEVNKVSVNNKFLSTRGCSHDHTYDHVITD